MSEQSNKMPPVPDQANLTSLKLRIQQIHPTSAPSTSQGSVQHATYTNCETEASTPACMRPARPNRR